jgi:hypothetical protein
MWGESLPIEHLSQGEVNYLGSLPEELPTVEWVWQELDRVWDVLQLDNRNLSR